MEATIKTWQSLLIKSGIKYRDSGDSLSFILPFINTKKGFDNYKSCVEIILEFDILNEEIEDKFDHMHYRIVPYRYIEENYSNINVNNWETILVESEISFTYNKSHNTSWLEFNCFNEFKKRIKICIKTLNNKILTIIATN